MKCLRTIFNLFETNISTSMTSSINNTLIARVLRDCIHQMSAKCTMLTVYKFMLLFNFVAGVSNGAFE